MKRLLLALSAALLATPALAGNIANCEIMVVDADEAGAAAGFMDGGEVVRSMLDPETPILAVIDGRIVQAVMCTRRDPIPDVQDTPLIASGIPFILSTNFDSSEAPLVTLALDEERRAVARMAVGLSERQQARLRDFLDAYTPPERPMVDETPDDGTLPDDEAFEDDVPEMSLAPEVEEDSDALSDALEDLLSSLESETETEE